MGQISDTQIKMLLDEKKQKQIKEINPQGYGYLCEDGKLKVTRIKVAEISQMDKEEFLLLNLVVLRILLLKV